MGSNMKYKRIIFCSRDCTYRAPVAAEVLRRQLEQRQGNGNIRISARGRVVLFPEPVNGKAVAIGHSKGYNLERYTAVELEARDMGVETLVLVMTEADKQKVYDNFESAINVYTIKEFIGAAGDVEIPFGKSLADYGESFNQIEQLVGQVADKILQIEN